MRSPAARFSLPALLAILLVPRSTAAVPAYTVLESGQGLAVLDASGRAVARIQDSIHEPVVADAGQGKWLLAGLESAARPRLALWSGLGGERRKLANPSSERGSLQLAPTWLPGQRLPHLVWLEGDDPQGLEIRAAAWNGKRWTRQHTIAPRAPGSQLGLTAVEFGGQPLVVWTAFDGHDDEVLWSILAGKHWSHARRLDADNSVPDVAPALALASGGVLAAWNRMENNSYRVAMARFDGSRWGAVTLAGPPSSSTPVFIEGAQELGLLYRTGNPAGFELLELDAFGAPTGRSASWHPETSPHRRLEPPLAVEIGPSGAHLSFAEPAAEVDLPWRPASPR
jgi:hypothetical protein